MSFYLTSVEKYLGSSGTPRALMIYVHWVCAGTALIPSYTPIKIDTVLERRGVKKSWLILLRISSSNLSNNPPWCLNI